jgi:hypothetical protein
MNRQSLRCGACQFSGLRGTHPEDYDPVIPLSDEEVHGDEPEVLVSGDAPNRFYLGIQTEKGDGGS